MASTINATAHGLSADDPFRFANVLPTDAGVREDITYYVLASNLTANTFEFSESVGGVAVDLVDDIASADLYGESTYSVVTDGIMDPPEAPDAPGSCVLTSTAVVAPDGTTAARLDITITQPASDTLRHTVVTVTGGSNVEKVVIPVGQTTGSIAFVVPGIEYTGTAIAYDTFGLASDPEVSAAHTAVGDLVAPDSIAFQSFSGGVLSVIVSWEASDAADFSHYEFQLDDNDLFTSPATFILSVNHFSPTLAPGTWYWRIRAVDHSGNASAWTSESHADSILTDEVDNANHKVQITPTQLVVEDGALVIKDEFGETVLVASGFSGTWEDFLANGLYNASFKAATAGTLADGRLVGLPYWTVSRTGTPTATVVADGDMPGGHVIHFDPSNTTQRLNLVSDRIGVVAYRDYLVGVLVRATAGGVTSKCQVTTKVKWYDETDTLISTLTFIRRSDDLDGLTLGNDGVETTDILLIPDQAYSGIDAIPAVSAPQDAHFARVEVELGQVVANNAATVIDLAQVSFREDPVGINLTGFRQIALGPALFKPGEGVAMEGALDVQLSITTSSGDVSVENGAYYLDGLMFADRGSSFPGSPTSGDRFYRTDHQLWFVWNGTRWLTENLYVVGSEQATATATGLAVHRLPLPFNPWGGGVVCEDVELTYFVNGGTALSGSHKWEVTVNAYNSGATIQNVLGSFSIATGSLSVWRRSEIDAADTFMSLANNFVIQSDWVKTGTPGNVFAFMKFTYRLAAT